MTSEVIKAPFPYFGGKSRVAPVVWEYFGDVTNYVEPFAGSLAVLLGRPYKPKLETVNDKDTYLANFWRALQHDPDGVAAFADWPVNEADLRARHLWLVQQADFRERMMSDPDYYDIKIAGWWVWGISAWIGGGWCEVRERPHRRRFSDKPQGVHRRSITDLGTYMNQLSQRLRQVRVLCGDWRRAVTRSMTYEAGTTAIFLDPPYSAAAKRDPYLYAVEDLEVAHQVREWAIENGSNPKLRIALCGYEEEHGPFMPKDWTCVAWKASGGYGNMSSRGSQNRDRERIWFSPHCLKPKEFE